MTVDIYLPCDVFQVEITVGPSERLSKLEALFLEAVAAGVSNIEELTQLFHLGARPTLDLVIDLWRRPYLLVDPASGAIQISERVREYIDADGRLQADGFTTPEGRQVKALVSGDVFVRTVRVMQELVSQEGHTLSPHRRPLNVRAVHVAPANLAGGALQRAPRHEVIAVLDRMLSQERLEQNSRRNVRVLSANLGSSLDRRPPERALLEVRVDCQRDPDTDRLSFRIVHPPTINRRVCTDIERGLASLAEVLPDHSFFRAMRDLADPRRVSGVREPGVLLQQLRESIAALHTAEAGTAAQRHNAVLEKADETAETVREHVAAQVKARFVVSASDLHGEMVQAIAEAERQVLLCSPLLRYEALRKLQPRLEEAMNRRVRIFLLWGRDDSAELEDNVKNLLGDLKQRFRDRLCYAVEPARVGARFVVKDLDRVIVASLRLLDGDPGAGPEIGVVLRSPSPGLAVSAARELLRFGQGAFPHTLYAQEMAVEPEDLDLSLKEPPRLPEPPDAPVATDAGGGASYSRVALNLWQRDWSGYVTALDRVVAQASTSCQLLLDGRHRELLWSLVRRPLRRLVLLSQALEPNAVNSSFLDALTEHLVRGARIIIVFARTDPGVLRRLEVLARDSNGALTLHLLARDSAAGYLEAIVGDDVALVTSFPLLAHSGHYDGRRRLRSEAGLLLQGTGAADKLLQALVPLVPAIRHFAIAAPTMVANADAAVAEPGPPTEAPGLQELLAALQERAGPQTAPQAQLLRQYFQQLEAGETGPALRALAQVGFPSMPLAAACCLTARAWDEPGLGREHGLSVLVRHLWQQECDPFATLILLQVLPPSVPGLPPQWLAELWASRSRPDLLVPRLEEASLRAPLLISAAVGSIALAALLIDGLAAARECLDVMSEQLPGPLATWAEAALEYYDEVGAALPQSELGALLDRQKAHLLAHRAGVDLQQALATARNASFRFRLGEATWRHLFAPAGPMGMLEQAVAQGDWRTVNTWFARHDDIDRLLDEATLTIWRSEYRNRRIEFPKRGPLLGRLRDVVRKAHDWARRYQTLAVVEDVENGFSTSVLRLCRRLRETREEVIGLRDAAVRDECAEAPLLTMLLGELRPALEVPR